MTEYQEKMAKRNAEICACYQSGQRIATCAKRFNLSKQRVQQVLKNAGLWRARERSGRTKFLGVTIDEQTKAGLKQLADQQGVSVSQLASDALGALVKEP